MCMTFFEIVATLAVISPRDPAIENVIIVHTHHIHAYLRVFLILLSKKAL